MKLKVHLQGFPPPCHSPLSSPLSPPSTPRKVIATQLKSGNNRMLQQSLPNAPSAETPATVCHIHMDAITVNSLL